MRLWRIEEPNTRVGPWLSRYRSEAVMRDCPTTGHHPSNGPSVREDCFGDYSNYDAMEGRVCACVSIGQLKAWWFKDYHLELLEKNGFVLAEYEAPEEAVAVGRAQVAVKLDAMRRIADHKPTIAIEDPQLSFSF
jgi:hypothetical protein